ncbi:MAG: ImmA/IrrE family metallo-endopeptidase [Chloroflexota bacterium]
MAVTERQDEVARLLRAGGVTEPPVPVEKLAQQHGAAVRYEPSRTELAGMLFRHAGQVIIGVNSLLPRTRQRFALAHELGHLLLHPDDGLHIDRHFRGGSRGHAAARDRRLDSAALSLESMTPALTLDVEALLRPIARGGYVAPPIDIHHLGLPGAFAGLVIPELGASVTTDRVEVAAEVRDQEANRFAIELLLPESLLRSESLFDLDYEGDAAMGRLAECYQVSLQLLLHRLFDLGRLG